MICKANCLKVWGGLLTNLNDLYDDCGISTSAPAIRMNFDGKLES